MYQFLINMNDTWRLKVSNMRRCLLDSPIGVDAYWSHSFLGNTNFKDCCKMSIIEAEYFVQVRSLIDHDIYANTITFTK